MARVMVVDDSRFMIKTLRSMFEKMGHEVVAEANDGVHAYVEYEKHRPDIVTLDMNMPLLDGRETIAILMKSFPEANIIMISSEHKQETIIDCVKMGANHYIIKPITQKKLEKALDRVLGLKG